MYEKHKHTHTHTHRRPSRLSPTEMWFVRVFHDEISTKLDQYNISMLTLTWERSAASFCLKVAAAWVLDMISNSCEANINIKCQ
jgi:hypothetical protein